METQSGLICEARASPQTVYAIACDQEGTLSFACVIATRGAIAIGGGETELWQN